MRVAQYRVRRMDANVLRRYADLIVSVGANVQPGQVLAIEGPPEAQPLVAEIARAAYDRGARFVEVLYVDGNLKRIRAERAPDDSLEWVPPWLGQRMLGLGELDAARSCCRRSCRRHSSTGSTPRGRAATCCRACRSCSR